MVAAADLGPERRTIEADELTRAFATLSESDQELLRLIAWDGLGRPEAARVLGIGLTVFSVRLHRARRRLANALSDAKDQQQQPRRRPSAEVPR
jgi:RNA polymerase sigma-70 factor (ECF subfamily)